MIRSGNDNLHSLTRNKQYILRIDLIDFSGNSRHAIYDDFKLGTDCDNFKLVSVGTYSGNAGETSRQLHIQNNIWIFGLYGAI